MTHFRLLLFSEHFVQKEPEQQAPLTKGQQMRRDWRYWCQLMDFDDLQPLLSLRVEFHCFSMAIVVVLGWFLSYCCRDPFQYLQLLKITGSLLSGIFFHLFERFSFLIPLLCFPQLFLLPFLLEPTRPHKFCSLTDNKMSWSFFDFDKIWQKLPILPWIFLSIVEIYDGFNQYWRIRLTNHISKLILYLT